jgi:hypothetical protein
VTFIAIDRRANQASVRVSAKATIVCPQLLASTHHRPSSCRPSSRVFQPNRSRHCDSGVIRTPMKKERRHRAAPGTPTKGSTEQHLADAPISLGRSKYCFCSQEPSNGGSGWSFSWKQRRSDCQHDSICSPLSCKPGGVGGLFLLGKFDDLYLRLEGGNLHSQSLPTS